MSVNIFIIALLCIHRIYCQFDTSGPLYSVGSKEKNVKENSYSQDNEDYILKQNVDAEEHFGSAENINHNIKKNKNPKDRSESENRGVLYSKKKKQNSVENSDSEDMERGFLFSKKKRHKDSNEDSGKIDILFPKKKKKKYSEENRSEDNYNYPLNKKIEDTQEDISEEKDPAKHRFVQEFNDDEDAGIEDFKRHESDENEERLLKEELEKEREKQKQAGSVADYFGTNQHYEEPVNFYDFGRRFVLSYPYIEINNTIDPAEMKLDRDVKKELEVKKHYSNHLNPLKAPPEFVLSIAKQSAILEATKPRNPSNDVITKDILRTGKFWNGVWKEDVDEKTLLRTSSRNSNKLEKVTVEIEPGSKLYQLVSVLKKRSPVLLYVVNKYNAD